MQARAFARGLKLAKQKEWQTYAALGKLPADVPADPLRVYRDQGWDSWGDWLGTGRIANRDKQYRTFSQARAFARSLKLKSGAEWRAFSKSNKLPADVPVDPRNTYKDEGWAGIGDWLGTGVIATHLRQFRTFAKARTFARSLQLKSGTAWNAFVKSSRRPADIPTNPPAVYADTGWSSWGDWLGTGTISPRLRQYRPFTNARAFARSLKLKSKEEWAVFTKSGKLPDDIPTGPTRVYRGEGWIGWGDWLGTGTVATYRRLFQPFVQARTFARSLKLISVAEWTAFIKTGKLPPI